MHHDRIKKPQPKKVIGSNKSMILCLTLCHFALTAMPFELFHNENPSFPAHRIDKKRR